MYVCVRIRLVCTSKLGQTWNAAAAAAAAASSSALSGLCTPAALVLDPGKHEAADAIAAAPGSAAAGQRAARCSVTARASGPTMLRQLAPTRRF
eukprot:351883-Chlamydomonas_euryale.AAC.5